MAGTLNGLYGGGYIPANGYSIGGYTSIGSIVSQVLKRIPPKKNKEKTAVM